MRHKLSKRESIVFLNNQHLKSIRFFFCISFSVEGVTETGVELKAWHDISENQIFYLSTALSISTNGAPRTVNENLIRAHFGGSRPA